MAKYPIINGGLPDPLHLTSWESLGVQVTMGIDKIKVYEIQPSGFMRQKVTKAVTGTTTWNIIYRMPGTYSSATVLAELKHNSGHSTIGNIFLAGKGPFVGYVTKRGELPSREGPKEQYFSIQNTTDAVLYIAEIQWYWEEIDESGPGEATNVNEFIKKAFMYGADVDKPELGIGGGTDG